MIIENESLLEENCSSNPLLVNAKRNSRAVFGSFGSQINSSNADDRTCWYYLNTFWKCVTSDPSYKKFIKKRAQVKGINSVSKCDRVSRILFPTLFLLLNIIYWKTYYVTN